jgi:hypothetical protein
VQHSSLRSANGMVRILHCQPFDTLGNHPRHFGLAVCDLLRAVPVVVCAPSRSVILMMQPISRKSGSDAFVRRLSDVHASRGRLVRASLRFDSAASAGHLFISRESSMSHAEHASKPLPVFAKLAALLRNIPAVRFVFAKFAALRRAAARPPVRAACASARSAYRGCARRRALNRGQRLEQTEAGSSS